MQDTEQSNKPITVMIVDDSRVQLQFAVDLCQQQGWSVTDTASDGMEALLKLKKIGAELPDLLLLDLEMPGLNGVSLLQELARLHLHIPILILSSRELSLLDSARQMAQHAGLNVIQIAQKPLRAEVLQTLSLTDLDKVTQSPEVHQTELLTSLSQLQTVYTPSVSIETGLIHHISAQLAWVHPQQGLQHPRVEASAWQDEKEFLLAMEQHQNNVFAQIQEWNASGLSLTVQLELPLQHIQTALHARSLLNQLSQYGILEHKICFEIPLSTGKPPPLSSLGALNLLRIQNIGLAIRDFNLEFNWVTPIRSVPFNHLILSDEPLNNHQFDPRLGTLCQHSISLAHQLQMTVHAEGVSRLADWQFLHQQHCDSAQGPLISPALSANEIRPWIKENLTRLRQLAIECIEPPVKTPKI